MTMQKLLITFGIVLLAVGVLWPFIATSFSVTGT